MKQERKIMAVEGEETSTMPNYPGIEIQLGFKTYLMPPLGMVAVIEHDAMDKLALLQKTATESKESGLGAFTKEMINNLIDLIHLALTRNYPKISRQEVLEGIPDVITATMLIGPLISQNNIVQAEMAEILKNSLTQQRPMGQAKK